MFTNFLCTWLLIAIFFVPRIISDISFQDACIGAGGGKLQEMVKSVYSFPLSKRHAADDITHESSLPMRSVCVMFL